MRKLLSVIFTTSDLPPSKTLQVLSTEVTYEIPMRAHDKPTCVAKGVVEAGLRGLNFWFLKQRYRSSALQA